MELGAESLGHYKHLSIKLRGLKTAIPSYPVSFNRCLSPLIIDLHLPATAHSRNLSSSGSSHVDMSNTLIERKQNREGLLKKTNQTIFTVFIADLYPP